MTSVFGKTLWIITALVTALAALHIGLQPFGFNVLHGRLIQMQLHGWISTVDAFVGLCGLYVLVTTLMEAFGKKCSHC